MERISMRVRAGRTGAYGGAYHGPLAVKDMSPEEAKAAEASGDWEKAPAKKKKPAPGAKPAEA